MHHGELEGSSGRLWGSSWLLGKVLWGAQAVPGTFAGDLKSNEKTLAVMVLLALWGASSAIQSSLWVQEGCLGELWDEIWASLMDLEARRRAPWSPFGRSGVSGGALGGALGGPKRLRGTLTRIGELVWGGPGPPPSYKLKVIAF